MTLDANGFDDYLLYLILRWKNKNIPEDKSFSQFLIVRTKSLLNVCFSVNLHFCHCPSAMR